MRGRSGTECRPIVEERPSGGSSINRANAGEAGVIRWVPVKVKYVRAEVRRRRGRRTATRCRRGLSRWIVLCKKPPAIYLPGNRRLFRARAGRIRATHAAVRITDEHASLLIDRFTHEVEQVATGIRSTLHPDTAALHRVGRRRIDSRPGISRVKGMRDIEVPFTLEVGVLK